MLHKKVKKTSKKGGDATRARVKKEMAQPRMAKSARKMLGDLADRMLGKSPLANAAQCERPTAEYSFTRNKSSI
jgi:hypothetical protein